MLTEETKKKIKANLVNFRHITLQNEVKTEYSPAKYHYELSDLLLNSKENIAIEIFREGAKSNYALRAFPLYCLAYPSQSRDYILIVKGNQDQASAKLKEIQDEHQSNPLIKHNLVEIKECSAKVYSVDLYNEYGEIVNVRIEAYGKGSAIRGTAHQDRRPKIAILDDIQDKDDARSEAVLARDWEWFLSDIKFLGEQTRIFLIGNNLGEKCVIERVQKAHKELGYKAMKVPIAINGVPSWPSRHSMADIEAEKANFAAIGKLNIWYAEKMCVAVPEEARIFSEEDYRYYAAPNRLDIAKDCAIYAVLDPASSTNPEACYRAIVVVGVDSHNRWFILDIKYGRWDSAETLDWIFAVCREWRLDSFGIEKGHFKQVLEPFLIKEQQRRNHFFSITPLEHGRIGTKLERIKLLQPRFKAHTVYFPGEASWLAELKTELAGITKDDIKSEYCDCVDALAMCEQVAIAPIGTKADGDILSPTRNRPQYAKENSLF